MVIVFPVQQKSSMIAGLFEIQVPGLCGGVCGAKLGSLLKMQRAMLVPQREQAEVSRSIFHRTR